MSGLITFGIKTDGKLIEGCVAEMGGAVTGFDNVEGAIPDVVVDGGDKSSLVNHFK
ncbi:MAG: hypothetical protein SFY68_02805 [Candidatus Sumerlaeia bacterium]|nr:hypothetical protein [Candidatus Sumerlaeia bacterium]